MTEVRACRPGEGKVGVFCPSSGLDLGLLRLEARWIVGGFMADLAGRRSVLFPKIQREAGKKNQRYEIFGEESSLCEVLVW